MTYRVVTLPQAEREIRVAARRIFERSRSSRTSIAWVKRVRAKIQTLQKLPFRCPVDPDTVEFGEEVRVLVDGKPGGRYKIRFHVIGDEVRIISFRHAARDHAPGKFGIDDDE